MVRLTDHPDMTLLFTVDVKKHNNKKSAKNFGCIICFLLLV